MEIIGEILVEFLAGLADFDERKYSPFGFRYWLGWLRILLISPCFSFMKITERHRWFNFIVPSLFLSLLISGA
ncbi:TPA: hypothetical protein TXJ05_002274 [Streptococcus suis]|nr:hypothetical protein [Streptococcus suis]